MHDVNQVLDSWKEAGQTASSEPYPSVDLSAAIAPQESQSIAATVQTLSPIPQSPEKPYWFKLVAMAIVVGFPCVAIVVGLLLWVIAAPNRQSAAMNEQLTAIAMTAKPNTMTITYACNTMLWGASCPPMAIPQSGGSQISYQGTETNIAIGNAANVDQRWLATFRQKSLAELGQLKAQTTEEQARSNPSIYQALTIAYQEKAGRS
jgi:hypothetical protein